MCLFNARHRQLYTCTNRGFGWVGKTGFEPRISHSVVVAILTTLFRSPTSRKSKEIHYFRLSEYVKIEIPSFEGLWLV